MSYGELSNTQETIVLPMLQMKNIRGKPDIIVSSKGIVNGLSNIPNDGADFGPDTAKGATAPGQYGAPYTETSGIQEASTFTNSNGGGKILLKTGSYQISAQIVLSNMSNIEIVGEDKAATIITGFSTTTVYALILGYTLNNITMSNFTFNVNNYNTNDGEYGDIGVGVVLRGNHIVVDNVVVYNSYIQGIVIGTGVSPATPSSHNVVRNCEVYNAGNDAIVLDYCQYSIVSDCYVHDSVTDNAGGINVSYGSSDCIVANVVAINTGAGFADDCTYGSVPVTRIIWINCEAVASYAGNGFLISGSTDSIIINPRVYNVNGNGILTSSTLNETTNTVFHTTNLTINNPIIDGVGSANTSSYGIYIQDGINVIINNPVLKNLYNSGILINDTTGLGSNTTSQSTSNVFIHNIINENNGNALRTSEGSDITVAATSGNIYINDGFVLSADGGLYIATAAQPYVFTNNLQGLSAPTLSTNPPVSGTAYQNTNPYDIRLKIPVTYSPTSTAAATLATGISSTSTVSTSTKVSIPAGVTTGQILTYDIVVPAGWYYELVVTNATIGTAEVQAA